MIFLVPSWDMLVPWKDGGYVEYEIGISFVVEPFKNRAMNYNYT